MSNDISKMRGRPRSDQVRSAIHNAFLEGMDAETYSGLSIDSVAKRAGVSRNSIYRWYKSKEDIALEITSAQIDEKLEPSISGDYEKDIRIFFRQTFEKAGATGPLFTALMAKAQGDPEFAVKLWEQYSSKRRAYLTTILEQNPNFDCRRSKAKAISLDTVLDLVFGSIWYRMMSHHAPLNDRFIRELCEMINRSMQRRVKP